LENTAVPIVKGTHLISSLHDWEIHAGPKSAGQWVDGRSAKETARAWLDGEGKTLPVEVETALNANKNFGPVRSWMAEPEAKLRFDKFAGEPRNSDLAVHVVDRSGSYILAIEAKADEPFGETVKRTIDAAKDKLKENSRSNGLNRVRQLKSAILGSNIEGEDADANIRYQLLTACAGALCEAEKHGYSRALMLVQEFVTDKADNMKHRKNADDLDSFVHAISHGEIQKIEPGMIYGPITVPGSPILKAKVDLFIGKVSRNIRRTDG
jgi:hypothetical protein